MGIFKLVLPKMGESISEATLTKWLKSVGELVQEDDSVAEIATDKVDSEVPSPVEGVLKQILFEEGAVVQVGDVIAILEVEGEGDVDAHFEEERLAKGSLETASEESVTQVEEVFVPPVNQSARFLSPLVRKIVQEEGISQTELNTIQGTGSEGRLTKQDVLNYIGNRSKGGDTSKVQEEPMVEVRQSRVEEVKPETPSSPQTVPAMAGDERIEMDRMRKLIADHMVSSKRTSPHVFSVVEADVTNLVNWRNKVKEDYKRREGENITFTPLIIEAISKAIKDFPMINVSVDGSTIIKRKHINIGMAAALPSGNLIVPVIRNADQLSLVGLSKTVNDLANRARANKLKPDDTQMGTFTFTNIGAFGNIFGMPIINQPQAAILAAGSIVKKPAVLETAEGDVIAIRHMMYLTMSYDHRVIDGSLGGQFLRRVGDYLENWDKDREI